MTKSPDKLLHRLAQGNSPWVAYTGTKFDQRFDDFEKQFLVLYACSERLGCFIECLAHFRHAKLPCFDELEKNFGPSFPQGMVPSGWCTRRSSQSAKVTGLFADITHSSWIASLQVQAPPLLLETWIDQSAIYQAKCRSLTQWIARRVFDSEENFAGIYYTSRHGSELSNWAIFEGRADILEEGLPIPLAEDDADLLAACSHLQIEPPSGTLKQTG